jgi:formamidopyrimidine-DNA glycosylase
MPRRPAAIPRLPVSILRKFHPAVQSWFEAVSPAPIRPQVLGWTAIAQGQSTLYKSETCFLAGVNPFERIADLSREQLDRIVSTAKKADDRPACQRRPIGNFITLK